MSNKKTKLIMEMLTTFPSLENVFNPYKDYDAVNDNSSLAPMIRSRQIENYFDCRLDTAECILIAEAPGCNGAKFSGIAMTDERTILGKKQSAPFKHGDIIDIKAERTSVTPKSMLNLVGMNESTSTVLYNFLYVNKINPKRIVTWNAFPFHPHEQNSPMSNRAPKSYEIEAAIHIQQEFFSLFSGRRVIAIGNHAKELMDEMYIKCEHVRHPSYGGAKVFTEFMESVFDTESIQSELLYG